MADEENIKFTSDEVRKLTAAFQDKKFLKLFQEYVEDINSAESRQKYEEEVTLLEKDRGYDVKFVHPVPGYVIKFSSDDKKSFVNICKNEHAGRATYEQRSGGTQWKIPVIASKPRDDTDRKGCKCTVYDIMFHPQTLELAAKNQRFRALVEDTATSTIQENFGIIFDVKTAKYPKMNYKGKPPDIVLRRKTGSKEVNIACEPFEEYWKNNIKHEVKTSEEKSLPKSPIEKVKKLEEHSSQAPVIPQHSIKYRDIIDMKDFSLMGYTDKCAPKEIIVEISLPGVQSTNDIELDIHQKKLTLRSCQNVNHHYYLDVNLSYAINTKEGQAKFDKSNNKLTVQLPLKDRGIPVLHDNGKTA